MVVLREDWGVPCSPVPLNELSRLLLHSRRRRGPAGIGSGGSRSRSQSSDGPEWGGKSRIGGGVKKRAGKGREAKARISLLLCCVGASFSGEGDKMMGGKGESGEGERGAAEAAR